MADPSTKKLISIVIPVLNEEPNILLCYGAIAETMSGVADNYDYEMIFTDNHSTDNTFKLLQNLCEQDKKVKLIRFSRNFGYQKSILTGFLYAKGDAAIQLDCDLQDPPKLIPAFLRHWETGYKVVYGIRRQRRENYLLTSIRRLFYVVVNKLSEDSLPLDAGDFRLIDRSVINALRFTRDSDPYLRGTISSIGFQQIGIPYARSERKHGNSKFRSAAMVRLAVAGVLNHSVIPLQIATYVGLFISISMFILAIVYFVGRITFGSDWLPGFATTTILILLSFSLNAIFLGIIGTYVGRIFSEVRRRPLTIVEEVVNIEEGTPSGVI